jgi:RNA polymerase sigma-70 factor (ECF subfamily)
VTAPRLSNRWLPSSNGGEPSPNGSGRNGVATNGSGPRSNGLNRNGAQSNGNGHGRRRRKPPSLDLDQFEAVRLALKEKLRHQYHQTDSFIADKADEMVDQAYIELAEACERGADISSPIGWLITTAVRRAIDAARRDGRELYGEGAELIIENAEDEAPTTEAMAVGDLAAVEIHNAVAELPADQQQALALYYWEGLTTRQAAEAMHLSNPMTFLRRRDAALSAVKDRLGIEPDDSIEKYLAIEAGFAAWVLMAANSSGTLAAFLNPAVDAADAARHAIASIPGRIASIPGKLREIGTSAASSGGSEAIGGAVSSGSAGALARVAGVCAVSAAAAICGAGAVGIGPGATLFNGGDEDHQSAPHVARRIAEPPGAAERRPAPVVVAPPIKAPKSTAAKGQRSRRTSTTKHGRDSHGRKYSKPAREAVQSQTLQPEPAPVEPLPESIPEEPSYVGEPEGGGSSSATSAANQQFGLP